MRLFLTLTLILLGFIFRGYGDDIKIWLWESTDGVSRQQISVTDDHKLLEIYIETKLGSKAAFVCTEIEIIDNSTIIFYAPWLDEPKSIIEVFRFWVTLRNRQ